MSIRRGLAVATLLAGLLTAGAAQPAEEQLDIRFLGLHSKQAKVSLNRRSYRVRPGEVIKGSVRLISATRREAVIAVGDSVYRFVKGQKRGEALPSEVVLQRDSVGMFEAPGAINGVPVSFLVDTGATFVTLSAASAKRLGLKVSKKRAITLQTASRTESAYRVDLESVRVGGIVRLGVPAVVTRGDYPVYPLLGNSFLGSVAVSQKEQYMLLDGS